MADSSRDEIARLQEEYDKNPEGRLFVHLAEAYRRAGELEKAREILQQGLGRHPDYLSARIVLAQVETDLGDERRAMSVWREVVDLDPDNELALWALGELEYNAGNPDRALEYYRRLEDLGVDDAELYEMIGLLEGTDEGAGSGVGKRSAAGRIATPAQRQQAADQGAAKGKQEGAGRASRAESVNVPAAGERARDTGSAAAAAKAAPTETSSAASERRPSQPRSNVDAETTASGATTSDEQETASAATHVRRRNGSAGGTALVHTDSIGLSDLLVRLLEYRDATFHAGSSLTRLLAVAIGRELELDDIHIEALALAALLSDLGGIGLSSDNGHRLIELGDSEERRRAEQREVALSLQLLQGITLPAGVHEAVRHQHERWDGKGYPDGLKEEEIPYGARVIAIARACASHLSHSTDDGGVTSALEELQRNAGSRYDPVVVNVLRRVFQRRAHHGIGFGLGGRVLLVHPEELRGLSVASQLHSEGYVAEVARDAATARTALRRTPPRAVVLGASAPSEDLLRLIREVRGNADLAGIPVLVIDANDMDLRVGLLTAGADACFSSEVTFREFKATLDALLRRREEIDRPSERIGRVEALF